MRTKVSQRFETLIELSSLTNSFQLAWNTELLLSSFPFPLVFSPTLAIAHLFPCRPVTCSLRVLKNWLVPDMNIYKVVRVLMRQGRGSRLHLHHCYGMQLNSVQPQLASPRFFEWNWFMSSLELWTVKCWLLCGWCRCMACGFSAGAHLLMQSLSSAEWGQVSGGSQTVFHGKLLIGTRWWWQFCSFVNDKTSSCTLLWANKRIVQACIQLCASWNIGISRNFSLKLFRRMEVGNINTTNFVWSRLGCWVDDQKLNTYIKRTLASTHVQIQVTVCAKTNHIHLRKTNLGDWRWTAGWQE